MDFSEIIIERAKSSDVKSLTYLSKKAFEDDSKKFMGRTGGGPAGYATEAFTSKAIRITKYYKIRLNDYTTIGGVSLTCKGKEGSFNRIFIHPEYQNQGIGTYVMNYMEKEFPDITHWRLDTPQKNKRTNHFYNKCGYVKFNTSKGMNYYCKIKNL